MLHKIIINKFNYEDVKYLYTQKLPITDPILKSIIQNYVLQYKNQYKSSSIDELEARNKKFGNIGKWIRSLQNDYYKNKLGETKTIPTGGDWMMAEIDYILPNFNASAYDKYYRKKKMIDNIKSSPEILAEKLTEKYAKYLQVITLSDIKYRIRIIFKLDNTTILKEVCRMIYAEGGDVMEGMYSIYIDTRHFTEEELNLATKKLTKYTPILKSFIPENRRSGLEIANDFIDRRAANVNLRDGNGFIEIGADKMLAVRGHSGTLALEKILNWVKLCLSIISSTDTSKRKVCTTATLFKKIELDEQLKAYFSSRFRLFR